MYQLLDYPTEPKALIQVVIDQEGSPEKCVFSKVAVEILRRKEVSDSSIRFVTEGLKGLRNLNQLVDGVPVSIHSSQWKK